MKQLINTGILTSITLALSAHALYAQTNPVISIDEFGIGTLNGNPVPSILGPDPSGGVTTSPVLIYTLPFPVTPGDVVLVSSNEPPNSPSFPQSDVVRFWNSTVNPNQGQIIFYSDFSPTDPPDAPADSGLPSQLLQPIVGIPEVGPESGPNGAIYFPAFGAPGSVPGVVGLEYVIISDVPEPGSGALLISGVGVLFGVNRLRSRLNPRSRPPQT